MMIEIKDENWIFYLQWNKNEDTKVIVLHETQKKIFWRIDFDFQFKKNQKWGLGLSRFNKDAKAPLLYHKHAIWK